VELLVVLFILVVAIVVATGNLLWIWLGILVAAGYVGFRAYRVTCRSCGKKVITGFDMKFCNQCGAQATGNGLRLRCTACGRLTRSELNLNHCNRCGVAVR
jgi:rRNA maturation endonuclease Nob1